MTDPAEMTDEVLLPWSHPEFRANPYPWYDRLRREAPVYKDPLNENTYIVSRHEDITEFGKHPSLTMIAPSWVVKDKAAWGRFEDCIIVKDPPEHAALRARSNTWFSPKAVTQWSDAAVAAVDAVIDDLGPGGNVEAYRNLALIPAHHAMCKALGLPNDGFDTAARYMMDCMMALGAAVTPQEADHCRAAFAYLQDRVDHYITEARTNPKPGMASAWLDLVAAGEMTETQLNEGLLLFWASGTPNGAYLITGGFEIFARHPEVFELWRNEPEQRNAILNEIARLYTAEITFDRFTTKPLEISGVTVPAESSIRFLVASANRQPEIFSDPHEFRLDRPIGTPPHLTFGIGAHFCPGRMHSQAMAHAIYNRLAQRVKRIELEGEPIYGHDDRSARFLRLSLRLVV